MLVGATLELRATADAGSGYVFSNYTASGIDPEFKKGRTDQAQQAITVLGSTAITAQWTVEEEGGLDPNPGSPDPDDPNLDEPDQKPAPKRRPRQRGPTRPPALTTGPKAPPALTRRSPARKTPSRSSRRFSQRSPSQAPQCS